MTPAVKAALLSGAVFPGLGQIYLKRYLRGLVILIFTLLVLIVVVGITMVAVFESFHNIRIEGGAIDLNTLSNPALVHSAGNDILSKALSSFILCSWVFSVIDAYRIGKRKETDTKDET
jgi:TM2 domain-containing membrane protein YozV